ncbi:COX8 domain-containing protein [Osmerus mordax]|uniref:COX8 domain-containing protein n=1 Tax=Osmerus mordax TaxID=8014 RepID=UPI003510BAF4
MLVILRGSSPTSALIRTNAVLQEMRSNIYSKPPKNKIGPGQSFFIMSVFAVAMLVPAGWIMHHLPEYRQRPRPPKS